MLWHPNYWDCYMLTSHGWCKIHASCIARMQNGTSQYLGWFGFIIKTLFLERSLLTNDADLDMKVEFAGSVASARQARGRNIDTAATFRG